MIANFIEEHSRGKFKRTGKEVLSKTKEIQNPDNKFREDVNKKAFEKAIQNKKEEVSIKEKPSERYISLLNFSKLFKKSFLTVFF